jgi:hypothetical protein
VFSLGTYWASLSWDCLLGKSEEQVPYRAQQLRRLLCTLGPSFIKAGQVLANRPDIVREDYMNELCILQDNVPAFPDKVRHQRVDVQGSSVCGVSYMCCPSVGGGNLPERYRALEVNICDSYNHVPRSFNFQNYSEEDQTSSFVNNVG